MLIDIASHVFPARLRAGLAFLVAAMLAAASCSAAGIITNDTFYKDTAGNPIYSQGGGVFRFGGKYYWYGVKYRGAVTYYKDPSAGPNRQVQFEAVTCYSSTDLVHWKFENDVLTAKTPGLGRPRWFGRLGVVHNATTGKYVLISQYTGSAGAGELFATCDQPAGNFAFSHIQSTVANVANGGTGDQTVFTDTDGKSYLICSSRYGRSNLYVAPIRPSDSLAIEPAVRIFGGPGREGNCMFKYHGRYYFVSSNLHGWNASHSYVISATNILGPYGPESVITGTNADFSHVSQCGFFITVRGTEATTVLFCGDRWSDFAGNGLGYNEWCPLSFDGIQPVFHSVNRFFLDAQTGKWHVAPGNNYVLNPSFEADRVPLAALAGWTNWTNQKDGFPGGNVLDGHTGLWAMKQADNVPYQARTHQVVTGLPDGTYTLTAWVRSSGGQKTAELYARDFGGAEIDHAINTEIDKWKQVTVSNAIHVTDGRCDIGLYSDAKKGQWVMMDDVSLTKNPGLPGGGVKTGIR